MKNLFYTSPKYLQNLKGIKSSASEIDAVILNKKIIAKFKDGLDIFNTNTATLKRGSCYSFVAGTEYLQFLNDTNIMEAQISNKKLVAPISSGVKTATYSGFELDSAPRKMECKIIFSLGDGATSAAVALIANPNGNGYVANILKKSIHVVFDKYKVIIGLYSNSTQMEQITHIYPTPATSDGVTENLFSWEIIDNTLKIKYPNGEYIYTPTVSLSEYNGKYVIFEHFITNGGNPSIPSISYIGASNNLEDVFDDFNRPDGDLVLSASGHRYDIMPNGFQNKSIKYWDVGAKMDKSATLDSTAKLYLPVGTTIQDVRCGRHRWLFDDTPASYNISRFVSCTKPTTLAYINGGGSRLHYKDTTVPLLIDYNSYGGAIATGTEKMDSGGLSSYTAGTFILRDTTKPDYLLAWDSMGNQLPCINKGQGKLSSNSIDGKIKFITCPILVKSLGHLLPYFFDTTDVNNIIAKDSYYKWAKETNLKFENEILFLMETI